MFLFLAIAVHSVMAANVPRNFRVRLEREDVSSILRIPGHLLLDSFVWASTIRPRVMMDDIDGGPDLLGGEGTLFVVNEDGIAGNRQAFVDVSDMVSNIWGPETGMGFSLSYHATMTRNVDSILYLHSPDGSESLIMNPTNVTQFAYPESISYAHM